MINTRKLKWIYKYSHLFIFNIFLVVTLGISTSLITISKAFIIRNLIDSAIAINTKTLIQYLTLFALANIIGLALQTIGSIISTKSYAKLFSNIQKNIFSHILATKWIGFSKYHSGDLSTRVTSDIESVVNMIINIIPNIISLGVSLIGSFIVLMHFNIDIAIIALVSSPILVIVSRFYSVHLKKLYRLLQELESKYRSFLNESIQNIVIIKSFCLEKYNTHQLSDLQDNKLHLMISNNRLNNINNILSNLGSLFMFFWIFAWSSFSLSKGTITFGTISAMLQLLNNIQYPASGIVAAIPKAIASIASIERIMELENLEIDLNSNSLVKDSKLERGLGLELNNIYFSYTKDITILNNICMDISPGETLAIIGTSGEGKTTLIRLVLSIIYPDRGSIYVKYGNTKLELDASFRYLISYVPQGNTLFSGTIEDNLRCGNSNITKEDIVKITQATYIWDFIQSLKDGLSTIIGERGLGLSEGQAQRLAIARALLKKSPILILDEATSALDIETELKVLQTIRNLEHKPACLIITHRPSTLAICDRVLKLENGQLYEVNDVINAETAASSSLQT